MSRLSTTNGNVAFLKNFYPIDPVTNTVTICISVNGYDGIFNPIDPSPVNQRDLSPDFRSYIDECSAEIPVKLPTEIQIHVNRDDEVPEREEEIKRSIHQTNKAQTAFVKIKSTGNHASSFTPKIP